MMKKSDLPRIGKYQVLQEIGSGSFARVYLGEHIYLKTRAAIKVLLTDSDMTREEIKSFLAEARTIAGLRHPHIVHILDFDIEDGMPYLVMEYAPAGSLATLYPARTVLKLQSVLSYVKQMASALQFAHDRHIVHCDVKPENMLISEEKNILLSDFGIAVVFNSNMRTQDAITGTIYYMAPEQFNGKPEPASDQYALAVTVYKWLTGLFPFNAKNAHEMYRLQTTAFPRPLREINPSISRATEQIIFTALARHPQQRFPNIQAFAKALETSVQKQERKSPLPHSLPSRTKDNARTPLTESQLQMLLPAPSSLLPLATPDPIALSEQKVAPTPLSPQSQVVLPGDSSDTLTQDLTIPATNSSSPMGDRTGNSGTGYAPPPLIYPSLNVSLPLHSRPATGRMLLRYTNHTNWVLSLTWSPDGHSIASGSWDNTVQVWDAANGEELPIRFNQHHAQVEAVAWSPDGQRIASAGHEDTIYVWHTFSTRIISSYHGHQGPVWALAWSPDGQYIASAGQDQTVHLWDTFTGETIRSYSNHKKQITSIAWSPDGRYIASSDIEGKVIIWYATNGKTLAIHNENETVRTLAWSPDGNLLASATKEVHVWQISDRQVDRPAYIYDGHKASINALAWSPDGKYTASASDDKTVQIWIPG